MGLDLVAQGEAGAGIGVSGVVELVAEGGHRLGAPRGGQRVEPDEQLAGAGPVITVSESSRRDIYRDFRLRPGSVDIITATPNDLSPLPYWSIAVRSSGFDMKLT